MNNKKLLIIGLFLLAFTSTRSYSQNYLELFTGTTLETGGLYDLTNGRFVQSFDVNASYVFVNGGITYKNFKYIDAKNVSYYAGLGIGSLIQLQAGFSSDGFSIRNRYDFPPAVLFYGFSNYNPPGLLFNITLTPSVEKYFGNDKINGFFGLGIGISINNVEGIID